MVNLKDIEFLKDRIINIMKNSKKYAERMDSDIQSCPCKKEAVTTADILIDKSSKSSTGFSVCFQCTVCKAKGKRYEFPGKTGKYKKIL